MEAWSTSCVEGRPLFFSDEMDIPIDRNLLMEWRNKPPYNFKNSSLEPDRKPIESMEFIEPAGLPMTTRNSTRIASNSLFLEEESRWKNSSSIVEPQICLKLGRSRKYSEESSVLPASDYPSLPEKKTRTKGSSSYSHQSTSSNTTPLCQVLGCNLDLSSSKDYHKRHKVCDFHSKAAKVTVSGFEQRFCQQCSRFHLLGEFDDVKRSCRRRLAGHNQRRRKPQTNPTTLSVTRYMGTLGSTLLQKRTFFHFPELYDRVNRFGHITVKQENSNSDYRTHYYSNMESIIQKQPGSSNSSGALSLLSCQSRVRRCNGKHAENRFCSCDCGPTVDLIQLSSHLQRVEQQRNSRNFK